MVKLGSDILLSAVRTSEWQTSQFSYQVSCSSRSSIVNQGYTEIMKCWSHQSEMGVWTCRNGNVICPDGGCDPICPWKTVVHVDTMPNSCFVILYLGIPLHGAFVARHADEFPAIEFYRITVAAQLAVYNGIVLAWREKVTVTQLV